MCLFCNIVSHTADSTIEFENDDILIIRDTHPQAEIHVLVIPKKHYRNLLDTPNEIVFAILQAAKTYIVSHNIDNFRLVHNANKAAKIQHFHLHILGNIDKSRNLA